MKPQRQARTDTAEPEADEPRRRPWTRYRPEDGPAWLVVLWPLFVLIVTAPLPEVGPGIWTGINTGTHLAMAKADLDRNPSLEQMSWRRTSLVLLPPVYLFRRQRILGGAQWPLGAWVASFVVGMAALFSYAAATETIEDWSVAEVETIMEETIAEELQDPGSVQVDCGEDPQVVDDAIICVAEHTDGSSVQLRVTASFTEVAWEPVPGSATSPDR